MKLTSIRGRLGLLLLTFALLVTVSISATFWGLDAQKKDALVINLAGRQRMLIQQMTRLVAEIEGGGKSEINLLSESAVMFDQTLSALQNGGQAAYLPGQVVDLPAPNSLEVQSQLEKIHQTWETYHTSIDSVIGKSPQSPEFIASIRSIQKLSPILVEQADIAVRLFESEATGKLIRLRSLLIGFFAAALLLLAAGIWITRKSVLEPLQALGRGAERIGAGDLDTPVSVSGPQEIILLGRTFECMIDQLKASRRELVASAETLEKRVLQRTRELDALYEVSDEISSRLDVQHVLKSVTTKARHLLGGEVASLCLLDEKGKTLVIKALSGPTEAIVSQYTNCRAGFTGLVLSSQGALDCRDGECLGACGILATPYRASHLAAPLKVKDHIMGALCVGISKSESFSEDALGLLTKLANSATIALENAHLYAQAERVATLEERQRIAADMHDGLGQTISYLGLGLDQVGELLEVGKTQDAIQQLEKVRCAIDCAVDDVRNAVNSLMDDTPINQSLQQQLEKLVEEFTNQNGNNVELENLLELPLILPSDKAVQVIRVTKEALLNAQRHSQAFHIHVRLLENGDNYEVEIKDDGNGFDPAKPSTDGKGHFGLQIMQARATRLGGQLSIQSNPGAGTWIILHWPRFNRNG
jgi:two-component system nitrate/nitrite sensor histidine kinase NarX